VNVLSNLWEKLNHSKRYRESFTAAVVKRMLPLQVRVLRKQRDWSQARLAQESKLTQGVISRAEDPEYGNLTINTLTRIAAGFDCAFISRFVPFSELGRWYVSMANESALEVPSFSMDRGFGATFHELALIGAEDAPTWPVNPEGQTITSRSCTVRAEIPLQNTESTVGTTQTASVIVLNLPPIPRKGPHNATRTTEPHYPLPPVTTTVVPYTQPTYAKSGLGVN